MATTDIDVIIVKLEEISKVFGGAAEIRNLSLLFLSYLFPYRT